MIYLKESPAVFRRDVKTALSKISSQIQELKRDVVKIHQASGIQVPKVAKAKIGASQFYESEVAQSSPKPIAFLNLSREEEEFVEKKAEEAAEGIASILRSIDNMKMQNYKSSTPPTRNFNVAPKTRSGFTDESTSQMRKSSEFYWSRRQLTNENAPTIRRQNYSNFDEGEGNFMNSLVGRNLNRPRSQQTSSGLTKLSNQPRYDDSLQPSERIKQKQIKFVEENLKKARSSFNAHVNGQGKKVAFKTSAPMLAPPKSPATSKNHRPARLLLSYSENITSANDNHNLLKTLQHELASLKEASDHDADGGRRK